MTLRKRGRSYPLRKLQAIKARFHYERGKEHFLFVILIFLGSLQLKPAFSRQRGRMVES